MRVTQQAFRESLLDATRDAPEGLISPGGAPAGKRFDVYRNNVAVSLTEALIEGFPVVYKLVGDEFFRAMAGLHLRASPPRSQMMMFYGEDLPGFLETFPPAAGLPYLADVARLELALRRAYHAADAPAIDAGALANVAPDDYQHLRLALAPSVAVLRSRWPVFSIWRANTEADAPAPVMAREAVLITRPEYDSVPSLLPEGGADFVEALLAGESFGLALARAGAGKPSFDLTTTLGLLIAGRAITRLDLDT